MKTPISIWGRQTNTVIGGMAIIGAAGETGPCIGYIATDPDYVVQACNAFPQLAAALQMVASSENWRCSEDNEWDVVNAARSAAVPLKEEQK